MKSIPLAEAERIDRQINGHALDADYVPPGEAFTVPARRSMVLEWFADAANTALSDTSEPLVEGLLDEGAMSVIYGDSNAGKTFVALDLALHVATGMPWNNRSTKRGLVVYVAAEGGRKIKRRIAALRRRYLGMTGASAPEPLFALIRFPIDLRSSDADVNGLVAAIRGAEQEKSAICVWIVVDTLSRAMAGGDENSPVDMGRIVAAADRLRDETSAHFSFVHHTGKDAARGARGHSLLRAATDTEIEVTPETMTVTKQRDMESGVSLGFRLVDVEIGEDAERNPIRSAVVEWHAAAVGKVDPKETTVPAQSRLLMDVISAAIGDSGQVIRSFHDGPNVKAVSDEIVRQLYYTRVAEKPVDGETPKKLAARQRQAFGRAMKALIDRKLVVGTSWKEERWVWLP